MAEKILWKDSPSQLVNIWSFIFFAWTIIVPVYLYLTNRFTSYELSHLRLRVISGIFTQKIDEIELYRVRDYQVIKPFFLRLFGLGNIILITSDKNNFRVDLLGIKNPNDIKDFIRNNVERRRKETSTREVDFT